MLNIGDFDLLIGRVVDALNTLESDYKMEIVNYKFSSDNQCVRITVAYKEKHFKLWFDENGDFLYPEEETYMFYNYDVIEFVARKISYVFKRANHSPYELYGKFLKARKGGEE